jgi:hypothetical protein
MRLSRSSRRPERPTQRYLRRGETRGERTLVEELDAEESSPLVEVQDARFSEGMPAIMPVLISLSGNP